MCLHSKPWFDRPHPAVDFDACLLQNEFWHSRKLIWMDSDNEWFDVCLRAISDHTRYTAPPNTSGAGSRHAGLRARCRQRCDDESLLGILAEHGHPYIWRTDT